MMLFRFGLENGDENRSVAWCLSHPGCFAYGSDPDAAAKAIPAAVQDYLAWFAAHDGKALCCESDVEIQIDENWDVYFINENFEPDPTAYSINAWFLDDWKPLQEGEVERGLKLLSWSRQDLEATFRPLSETVMQYRFEGERWNIGGIVNHVATAEWWYLDRLGLGFPREEMPEGLDQRLSAVRSCLEKVLPTLVGSRLVVGTDGEFWSPRKMLRRAIWHERDHTFHIQKLLKQYENMVD